jgi:hypothetical protein
MLIALDVSGVALIDHLSVEFTEKLNSFPAKRARANPF